VADLHSVHFACFNHSGESIKKKFFKFANSQPRKGNPSMSPEILRAKEIKEVINIKAGLKPTSLSFLSSKKMMKMRENVRRQRWV
jgi:hypothetical protein